MPTGLDLTLDDLDSRLVWRFHRHHEPTSLHGCWLWRGPVDDHGYGLLKQGPRGAVRTFRAHRLSWVLYSRTPLVDGLTIDHRCYVSSCVNPLHLEPVSLRINSERAQRRRGH